MGMKKLPKEDNVRKENKPSNATKSFTVGSDVKRTMKKEGAEKDDTADLVFTFEVDDQDEDFVISLDVASDTKRPDRVDAIETPEDADLFEIHFDDERNISEDEENVSNNDDAKNEIIEDVLEAFSKAADNVNDILHEKNLNQDIDGIVDREDAEGVHNNYEALEMEIWSVHTCLVLGVLVMFLLFAVIGMIRCRYYQDDYELQTKSVIRKK